MSFLSLPTSATRRKHHNAASSLVRKISDHSIHCSAEESGSIFEGGAGYFAKLRWQRTKGAVFKTDDTFTPAAVKARWDEINDFRESTFPANITDTDYLVSGLWMVIVCKSS